MAHPRLVVPGGSFLLSAVLRILAVALGGLGLDVRDVGLPQGFKPSGQLDGNRWKVTAVDATVGIVEAS